VSPRTGTAASPAGGSAQDSATPASPAGDGAPREVEGAGTRRAAHAPTSPPGERDDAFAALLAPAAEPLPAAPAAMATPLAADPKPVTETFATPDQLLALLAGALALPVNVAPQAPPAAASAVPAGAAQSAPPAGAFSAPVTTTPGTPTATPVIGLAEPLLPTADTAAATEATPRFEAVLGAATAPAPASAAREVAPAPPPLQMPADPQAGFDDGIGTHVAWMAGQRLGEAHIRVNPEHLGPIEVSLQLDDSRVDAQFHSTNVEVRAALEASVPRLRELLAQHGLQLGQADVGQRHAPGYHTGSQAAATAGAAGGDGSDAEVAAPAPVHRRGLLDEYA
jgi:flagellar hook-length control protein FliK